MKFLTCEHKLKVLRSQVVTVPREYSLAWEIKNLPGERPFYFLVNDPVSCDLCRGANTSPSFNACEGVISRRGGHVFEVYSGIFLLTLVKCKSCKESYTNVIGHE